MKILSLTSNADGSFHQIDLDAFRDKVMEAARELSAAMNISVRVTWLQSSAGLSGASVGENVGPGYAVATLTAIVGP